MVENEPGQAHDVVDRDMVACLLSFAKQRDALLAPRRAEEAVGPIGVVRIAYSINQRRPENRYRRLGCGRDQRFPCEMHGSIEIGPDRATFLIGESVAEGVSGVGAEIDHM